MTTSERKWVYAFENGDGKNKMLLGGKGANLCEMTRIGLNVPPGFVITTEACLSLPRRRAAAPARRRDGRGARPHARAREEDRQEIRRRRRPAAGLGALRVGHVDAGHDGHHPQPRPQRDHARGADPPHRQRALRLRRVAALHPAVRQGRARRARRGVRRAVRGRQDARRRQAGRAARPRRPARCRRALPARRAAAHRPSVPGRPVRAARDRHQGGVQLLDGQARHRLSPRVQDHAGHGERHRGQRGDHGVRQHGQRQRHRRGLHAQPGDRREPAVRRVPHQRAGRGRGGGHPHAQGDRRPRQRDAGDLHPARRPAEPTRAPLPRGAGLRVHHRARHALLPADAQRQDERRPPWCAPRSRCTRKASSRASRR